MRIQQDWPTRAESPIHAELGMTEHEHIYAAAQQYSTHAWGLQQIRGAPVGLRSAEMPLTAASRW